MCNNLISVIIPVFNVEKYLSRCLDSVINSTYKNLEIICVNDGSTDNSGIILSEYAKKDKRIQIITQRNSGVSSARNAGLKVAKGAFITFVDSDDFITPWMYEFLLKGFVRESIDCVQSNYLRTWDKNPSLDRIEYTIDDIIILSPAQAIREILKHGGLVRNFVWDILFKKETITEFFPDGRIYEDAAWLYHILDNCREISVIPSVLYYYMQREGSAVNRSINPDELDGFLYRNERIDFFSARHTDLMPLAAYDLLSFCMDNTAKLHDIESPELKKKFKSEITKSRKMYRKYIPQILTSPDINHRQKIFVFLSCLNFSCASWLKRTTLEHANRLKLINKS